MMKRTVTIFISYAHEDEDLRKALEKHLSLLKRQGFISVWNDRDISAGTDWEQAISIHLDTAEIILLLISPDFIASEYCYSVEMKRAVERHQTKEARVIPIILRPADWEEAPFGQFQALPTDAAPILSHKWQYQDEAFVDVIKGLRKIIKEFVPKQVEKEQHLSIQKSSYVGKRIGGYSLILEIGRGMYGCVYWGQHHANSDLGYVAIKVMHPVYQDSLEMQKRFLQEIQILRLLKHSYILSIVDAGFHEGLPYIVTNFAANGSLRDRLNRQSPNGFSVEEALTIVSQIGQALDYAHQHNIIHRDLKPENILFDANNKALLADFGAAAISPANNKGIEITGTLPYMAPEQFKGRADKASDQYALGCIAYELFTGRTPFHKGGFASMWFNHAQVPPPPLSQYNPNLPQRIESAILKALAKEPHERHADIPKFLSSLYKDQSLVLKDQSLVSQGGFPISGQLRRLPLYLLLDCSESMAGEPISALNEGINLIYRDLVSDPQALETVYVSIITFSTRADQYQLTPIDQFSPPLLTASGARKAMGEAFRILVDSIEQDLCLNTTTQPGDYRPLVFLLTDGSPSDHYQFELKRLHALHGSRRPTIVALGCGSTVDAKMLHEVTENVFMVGSITPQIIRNFFQWISGSISQISSAPRFTSIEPPSPIPGITYSPN